VLREIRILIVEDNVAVASNLREVLVRAGGEVIGPVNTLAQAQRAAESEVLSVAILDIDLNGLQVWPVARILESRGIPFVFHSASPLADEWRHHVRLEKPAKHTNLIQSLAQAVSIETTDSPAFNLPDTTAARLTADIGAG
jgi:DNA-binding NtrC family response regulator